MKLLSTLALAAVLTATAFNAEARSGGSRSGYSSSGSGSRSGYVYRNPYAAHPSVRVRDYTRSSGTYVERHVRTPANDTLKDNLSYRGYGTVRVPKSPSY